LRYNFYESLRDQCQIQGYEFMVNFVSYLSAIEEK
jgi:hypothetical protein